MLRSLVVTAASAASVVSVVSRMCGSWQVVHCTCPVPPPVPEVVSSGSTGRVDVLPNRPVPAVLLPRPLPWPPARVPTRGWVPLISGIDARGRSSPSWLVRAVL